MAFNNYNDFKFADSYHRFNGKQDLQAKYFDFFGFIKNIIRRYPIDDNDILMGCNRFCFWFYP